MRERGRNAFFIRIKKIDASFDQAFEIGSTEEFTAWLGSMEEAWFFLDSVDQAQLETPRALEDAVRVFGARIHDALERTHIFITSREDARRALPDQTLVEQHLPYGEPEHTEEGNDGSRKGDSMLKLFRLAGLSEDEIALFAGHYGISDVVDFVDAIKRGNLLTSVRRRSPETRLNSTGRRGPSGLKSAAMARLPQSQANEPQARTAILNTSTLRLRSSVGRSLRTRPAPLVSCRQRLAHRLGLARGHPQQSRRRPGRLASPLLVLLHRVEHKAEGTGKPCLRDTTPEAQRLHVLRCTPRLGFPLSRSPESASRHKPAAHPPVATLAVGTPGR